MVIPKLGYAAGRPQRSNIIRIHPSSLNQHVMLTGKSGSGKTVALQAIERGIVEQGGRVLALNFNGTHESVINQGKAKIIRARAEGIPLPLLSPAELPDGATEAVEALCEGIVDIFDGIIRMGGNQKRSLLEACYEAVERRLNYTDDISCLYDCLQNGGKDGCNGVIDKYWNVLTKIKLDRDGTMWEDGAVCVIDLSAYNPSTQYMLADLVMQLLFRQHQLNGQNHNQMTWIVADEFQNLNLKPWSILARILREGRKFNLGLLLATQTLAAFKTGERAILQQTGTQLLFHPTDSDARRYVRDINELPRDKALEILKNLKVGECLAVGTFSIGTAQVELERPIKMSFQLM